MLKRVLALFLLTAAPAQSQGLTGSQKGWLGPDELAQLTPPPADPYGFQMQLAEAVMQAVNEQRSAAGLPPLSADPDLAIAAGETVTQLRDAELFGEGGGAKPLSARISPVAAVRYSKLGENLWSAQGALDWQPAKLAEQTAATWSTRANLMEPGFAEAGVATVTAGDRVFIAMVMAEPKGAPIVPASISTGAATAPAADLARVVRALPDDLLTVINARRVQRGMPLLRIDESLSVTAQEHSALVLDSGSFGTQGPDGTPVLKHVMDANPDRFGRVAVGLWRGMAGEALAVRATESWEQDAQGSANMLDPRFDRVGVGVAGQGEQAVVTILYGETAR